VEKTSRVVSVVPIRRHLGLGVSRGPAVQRGAPEQDPFRDPAAGLAEIFTAQVHRYTGWVTRSPRGLTPDRR